MTSVTPLLQTLLRENGFTEQESELFVGHFQPTACRAKELLLMEGRVCRFIGFVLSGFLKYHAIQADGTESVRYFAGPGDFVTSLLSFIKNAPAAESIEALQDCELLIAQREDYSRFAQQFPDLEKRLLHLKVGLLAENIEEKNQLLPLNAADRYRYFTERYPRLVHNVPGRDIASFLGIRPPSLSRIRRQLAQGH